MITFCFPWASFWVHLIKTNLFYDTRQMGLGPTLMTSLNLNYLLGTKTRAHSRGQSQTKHHSAHVCNIHVVIIVGPSLFSWTHGSVRASPPCRTGMRPWRGICIPGRVRRRLASGEHWQGDLSSDTKGKIQTPPLPEKVFCSVERAVLKRRKLVA